MTINEKIDYLFSKINWKDSNLDNKAIQIMNTLKDDIQSKSIENNTVTMSLDISTSDEDYNKRLYSDILYEYHYNKDTKKLQLVFIEPYNNMTIY